MTHHTNLRRIILATAAPLLAALLPTAALADMASDVKAVNDGWAHITYEIKGSSTQTKALDQLAKQANTLVARYPGKAEPLLWAGIVTSEQANRANFFHKLGLATKARDLIAKAYAIDPRAADGGAALSLGVLYYKVPGSPLAWGDDERAVKLLKQALATDPNGLDTNYFYGDYLLAQGDKAGARAYLQKALRAPHDASRPVWDAGRRREARDLLSKAG
ncbi:tetratricopeptide repeat protein [Novosphingobium colocasiae]|uniref:tetratricopeptide repeat protein n=1 Tax=Novosphingobium colocasiae TaxID=1256513 RepID=UPI0035B400D1